MPKSEPYALLVVPSEALRGMLDEGPCGFRPPMVWHSRCPVHGSLGHFPAEVLSPRCCDWSGDLAGGCAERVSRRTDLVLRWEGQDLPHGWLAASAVMPLGQAYSPAFFGIILDALREAGCTIIEVDAHGREVAGG